MQYIQESPRLIYNVYELNECAQFLSELIWHRLSYYPHIFVIL